MRTEVKTSISALVSEVELKVSNSSRQTVCQPKHVDYAFERCRLFSQRTAIIVELQYVAKATLIVKLVECRLYYKQAVCAIRPQSSMGAQFTNFARNVNSPSVMGKFSIYFIIFPLILITFCTIISKRSVWCSCVPKIILENLTVSKDIAD
jgi:hypothetical protein